MLSATFFNISSCLINSTLGHFRSFFKSDKFQVYSKLNVLLFSHGAGIKIEANLSSKTPKLVPIGLSQL